ncbi:hypothetical protein Zmor_020396 [Zophobas morio]|uniref:Chitin-binding type-2 domain-containing protein n=1 Tax=Zophobas morio TaxID=2755281 RepID=A0AA38I3J1_9CUCU|nr:hypothetical protein Zmor_020396 [Zophobas morio]
MMRCHFILIFIFTKLILAQNDIGTECPSPVKCLTDTEFTFCSIIDGQVVLQEETINCPTGYKCVEDPYVPCVEAPTTSSTTTATTTEPPGPSPWQQCTYGATFPAPKCFQYYECVRFFWWYELQLKTCFIGRAFDPVRSECVPIYQTNCSL